MRIQAPSALQQPLSAEHLMNARDAARKLMRGIEEGRIGIGNLDVARQPFLRERLLFARLLDFLQQLHRFPGPDRPVTEQTANDRLGDRRSVHLESIGRQQIVDDVIVIPRIERNIVSAA